MAVPLQITFKGMEPSPALEARIRRKAARLERFRSDILRCRVTIEAPHRHHRRGRLYQARVEVFVPRGDIVVAREGPQNHANEDPYVAVREAFDAVVRLIKEHVRRLGGRVKRHEPQQLSGRVARFEAEQGYGFIETGDGQEVYFHHNSVLDGGFERMRVGDEVRIAVAEGDKGLQASTVHRVGSIGSARHRRRVARSTAPETAASAPAASFPPVAARPGKHS